MLRPHQQEALEKVIAGLQTHDRGKLIMACGTGKTFTSLKIAEAWVNPHPPAPSPKKGEGEPDPEPIQNPVKLHPTKLRIGYISECLRRHSIGYLVRDLFQYHDRSKFEIFAYTFQHTDDLIQKEILSHKQDLKIIENTDPAFIYNLIQSDRIDILIDLDSLTHWLNNKSSMF